MHSDTLIAACIINAIGASFSSSVASPLMQSNSATNVGMKGLPFDGQQQFPLSTENELIAFD